MPNYKIVDADQFDADMKNIADKIRAKSGTSAKLPFPDGFMADIEKIQGVIPDDYVNLAEILIHCSRSASGEYSPTSNTTMNNIKITTTDAKGTFKPKIFVIFHNSRIENSGTDTAKIAVTASVTVARDDGSLLYKHSAGIYYNSTYRACSNQSGSRYFNPVSGGVQGVGSDFYLQSGKNYQWYAWG